jgi:hypothetical protein
VTERCAHAVRFEIEKNQASENDEKMFACVFFSTSELERMNERTVEKDEIVI